MVGFDAQAQWTDLKIKEPAPSLGLAEVVAHIHTAVMVAGFLLSTLFLAVAAQPIWPGLSFAKLPFAKCFSTGTTNLVKHDQLRVKTLVAKAQGLEDPGVINSQATNRAVFYLASVGVGSPATYCK